MKSRNEMPPPFVVERAQAADVAALSRIAVDCGLTVDFAAELARSFALLLVARESSTSGTASTPRAFLLAWRAADELHLTDLGVDSAFRRRGAARTLVRALELEARQTGAAMILLEVRASNAAALGLYRALGYAAAGERSAYYADTGEDAVVMRLELS